MNNHSSVPRKRLRRLMLNATPTGAGPLDDVIRAASAAAQPGELDGLSAAQSVFSSADGMHAMVTPARRRRIALKSMVAGASVTTMIAGAAAAAAIGTVAFIAAPGHGSAPSHLASAAANDDATTEVISPDGTTIVTTPMTSPRVLPAAAQAQVGTRSDGRGTITTLGATTTSASTAELAQLSGLCHAWQAHANNPNNPGKWMDATAFSRLAAAATATLSTIPPTTALPNTGVVNDADGEPDDHAESTNTTSPVAAYCTELIGTVTTSEPSTGHTTRHALPSQATDHPGKPTTRPTLPSQATDHPGKPTTRPTLPSQATDHPGKPTTRPTLPSQATGPSRSTEPHGGSGQR